MDAHFSQDVIMYSLSDFIPHFKSCVSAFTCKHLDCTLWAVSQNIHQLQEAICSSGVTNTRFYFDFFVILTTKKRLALADFFVNLFTN